MPNQDLLKRLLFLKKNPKLAEVLPQSDLLSMMGDLLTAFQTLQKAIETNKIKGEKGDKGDDGYTPVAGKDYVTPAQVEAVLVDFERSFLSFQEKAQKKIDEVRNGKDAEITKELIEEIASVARSLIELPDFDTLVSTTITANPESVRDSLELLQDGERLDASAIKGLEDLVKTVYVNGGTIGKNQVYNFIRQAVADGTIPAGGSGSGIVETIVAGTGISVDNTDPANPVVSATGGGGGAVDSVNGQTGVVVLDADDIDDSTTTNKFATQAEIDKLAGIEAGAEVNNISDTNANDLTDGGETTLHHHDGRYYTETEVDTLLALKANTASLATVATSGDYNDLSNLPDLTLFDNLESYANLAGFPATGALDKLYLAEDTGELYRWDGAAYVGVSTSHAPVTLAGVPDYITIVGQTITRSLINLASHVTGRLPFANLSTLSAHQVLGRAGSGTGDAAGITMGNDTILGRSGSGDVDALSATQVRTITETETTAQLNARDTANRDRANHTGTQLASTISDFAATVRATILTGISFATSTAVTASDSILTAIGKLQAQNTAQDTAIALNTAKVTNATHSGDMSGATTLTAQPALITGKPSATVASGDLVLIADINDSNALKQVTAQSIADLGGGGGNTFNDYYIDQTPDNGTYGLLGGTVNGTNAVFTVSQGVYATGTLEVYLNGQLLTQGGSNDWTETTPASGTFTFVTAPPTGSVVTARYATQVTNSDTILTTTNYGDSVVRVIHGSTASTARPTGATYVEWVGSVEPTNATNNDTWIETT